MVLPEADNALGLPDILGLDGKGMVAAQVNLNRRTLKRQSLQFNCPGSSFETALSYYYFEVSSFLQKCSVFRYLSNVSQFSGFVTRFLFSTCVPLISPTQNWRNWTHARGDKCVYLQDGLFKFTEFTSTLNSIFRGR